ncbi:MAG TPA: hypothetical protein VIX86_10265 [Streptosporangiaceae bacterium]
MQADSAGIPAASVWESLRARRHPPWPLLTVPAGGLRQRPAAGRQAGWPGLCLVCRGPVRPGYTRCFQCELHAQSAPGLLADTVAAAAYAVKGGPLARDLWLYKSGRDGNGSAAARVLTLLLSFLHDHGPGIWRAAGMGRPSAVCVVPTGRGRPGPHPLQALTAPYLALPWLSLRPRPGGDPWARALDPGRCQATSVPAGAAVLLLDDTWVSGASAQSAAVALKQAGAAAVAVVVAGRHVETVPAGRHGGPACPPVRGQ